MKNLPAVRDKNIRGFAGLFFMAAFLVIMPTFAQASITLTDWNLNWLSIEHAASVPADQPARTPAGFAALAAIARQLNSDIFAFEEVDGLSAAQAVFDPKRYNFEIAGGSELQRVGMAIRKGIAYERHEDLHALDVGVDSLNHHLRAGLDVTLHLDGGDLRVLVVHLKSGCFTDYSQSDACPQLEAQLPVLLDWIKARLAANEAYIVTGDFNRRFARNDSFWKALNSVDRMTDAAGTTRPACYNGLYSKFIDHVVAGSKAQARISAFHEYVYPENTDKNQISDHCPVSVKID